MRRLLLIACALLAGHAVAEPLRAAVAANFRDPFEVLARMHHERTGVTVEASYAATGMLYTQIVNGAPFALFFAADASAPAALERAGRAAPETRVVYAIGQLALWTPRALPGPDWLADRGHRFAIADPVLAPYGRAAMEVLGALGLEAGVESRIVKGTSIAQAAHFVASGAVPGGFVARSQLEALGAESPHVWRPPQTLYAPIVQEAVVVRGGDESEARRFLEFVRSREARTVIESFGYALETP